MQTVTEVSARLGVAPTCVAMRLPRAPSYRLLHPRSIGPVRPAPARAVSVQERQEVLEVLHEPRFADHAPGQVYATLLDQDRYLYSERTRSRLLADTAEVRERRDQLRHPAYQQPERLATGPNQVWSW